MGENERRNAAATRATVLRIVGMILFLAFVASWFIWGPLGLICYVGGRFNSLSVFMLVLPFSLLVLIAAIFLPVLAIRTIVRWRTLPRRERVFSSLLIIALTAFVASLGWGFAGMVPSPFDMFVRGFASYVESRTDVTAVQSWLATVDPNDCQEQPLEVKIAPGVHLDDPPKSIPWPLSLARFRSAGTRLLLDDAGRPMICLIWGGGMIGHWGILVGDKGMESPPAPDILG